MMKILRMEIGTIKILNTRWIILTIASLFINTAVFGQYSPDNPIDVSGGCGGANLNGNAQPAPANVPPPNCASNFGAADVVWFTMTLITGNEVLTASGGNIANPLNDVGMAVYTFNGTNYTLIACDDDTGVGLYPQISLNLTPGTVIYISMWDYGNNQSGEFVFQQSGCPTPTVYYTDADGDGFGLPSCDCNGIVPPNTVPTGGDCDDSNATINPNAIELCPDNIDQDCDGTSADCDMDGDGFDQTIDCNDNCNVLYPGAPCDDGNSSTVGDVYTGANCTCQGTPPSVCTPESAQSITFNGQANPPAVLTNNVQICYTLNYTQASGDWLDGIAFTFGPGWTNIQPNQAPANCGGGAPLWIWQTSNSASGATCGLDTGLGYYYDTNGNGNGGDDWGDAGACTFVACVTADMTSVDNLTVSVLTGGDSYFGSYNGCPNNCAPSPFNYPTNTGVAGCQINLPPCVTPTDCDVNTGNFSILAADGNIINVFNPPAGLPLVISLDGTPVQIFPPPIAGNLNLNITAATLTAAGVDPSLVLSDGQQHTLSASFPGSTCTATQDFNSPAACGCSITIPPASITATCTGTDANGIGIYDVTFEAIITAPPASGNLNLFNSCALGGETIALPDATLTDATPNIYTFSNVLVTAPDGLSPTGCELTAVFSANANCVVEPAAFYFPPITVVNVVSATQGTCQNTVNGSMNTIDLEMNVTNPPAGATTMDVLIDGLSVGTFPLPPPVTSAPATISVPAVFVENALVPGTFDHIISFDFGGVNCMAVNPTAGVPNTTEYPFTFTGPNGEVNANCVCSLNIVSATPSECNGYASTFDISFEIEISNPPTGQDLNFYIYDLTAPLSGLLGNVNPTPPGTPQTVNISDIPLPDGALAGIETLTASFTGFVAPAGCATTFDFNAPASCNCNANVGTFNISGASINANDIVICNDETLIFNSNDDFTAPSNVSGNPSQVGLGIAIYDLSQTVIAGDITTADNQLPLTILDFEDIIGGTIGDLEITNNAAQYALIAPLLGASPNFDVPIQFQAAIVTLYNTSTSPITIAGVGSLEDLLDPLSGTCGNVGQVYNITMTPPILLSTGIPNCQSETFTINASQGDIAINAFDWNIISSSPANIVVNAFPNGTDITITGLNNGDNMIVEIADPSGCISTIEHGPFVGPLVGSISLPAGLSANNICASTPPFNLVGNDPNGTWSLDPANPWTGPALSGPPLDATGMFYPSEELAQDPVLFTTILFTPAGCAEVSPPFTIAVQPTVVPTASTIPNLCANSPMLNLAFFGGPNGGEWAGNGVVNNQFNASLAGPGTHTLTYDVTNAPGVTCGTINDPSIPITVTVNDPSLAVMTPSLTEGCEDLEISLYNNNPNSINAIWKINGADVIGTNDSLQTTLTDPGCYDFTLITTDINNCVDTLQTQDLICVFPTPEVSFISAPSSATMDDPQFFFTNTSPNLSVLEWDFAGFSNSSLENPVYSFDDVTSAGSYEVCLLGTDANGCQNTYCNNVVIKDAFAVFTPTAITPDNDNLNEAFRPIINGADQVKNYHLRIFDRWGNIVFESTDMTEYWNANTDGNEYYVNNGVYHWLLEITLFGLDATQKFEGSLSVVR